MKMLRCGRKAKKSGKNGRFWSRTFAHNRITKKKKEFLFES